MENIKNRVLLVEDDKVDQRDFMHLVKNEDLPYEYTIAGSVSEAKKILGMERFDIVIMDYLLGNGTALDIFDLIIDTPFIFITGAGDEETGVKAMKAGAYDYLIKDPKRHYFKVLPITVESAIKRKKAQRQIRMLSHAIMNIEDSIYTADTDDKIFFVTRHPLKRMDLRGKIFSENTVTFFGKRVPQKGM